MAKIDWDIVRAEYIKSNPKISYRELAEKYGVHFRVLQKRATSENWSELRSQQGAKRVAKIEENLDLEQEKEAEEIAKIKRVEQEDFEVLRKALMSRLIKTESIKDADGNKVGEKNIIDPELTEQGVRALVTARNIIQTSLYRSYGIPDKHEISPGKGGQPAFIVQFTSELEGLAKIS